MSLHARPQLALSSRNRLPKALAMDPLAARLLDGLVFGIVTLRANEAEAEEEEEGNGAER